LNRFLLVGLVALLAGSAGAQLNLLVNGLAVAGATTSLVSNVTYVPAEALAAAIGAELRSDRVNGRVVLSLGSAIVQGVVVDGAAAAEATTNAWLRDGEPRPGTAALSHQGVLYLPLKAVGEAFGGRVSFLGDTQSVVLVLPRPTLTIQAEGTGEEERLRFTLTSPTAISSSFDRERGVLEVRFDRSDLPNRSPPALAGDGFRAIELLPARGSTAVRVTLPPGRVPRIANLPDGGGMQWLLAFAELAELSIDRQGRWVLDGDHALVRDAAGDATLTFIERLAEALSTSQLEIELSRPGIAPVSLADRSAQAIGADAFVSIYYADLPPGQLRLYYLGDVDGVEGLERAVRINAASDLPREASDSLRRSLLLRLITDLDRGERWALALAEGLARSGWVVDGPRAAPLAVLVGAAGRGLLL